MPGFFCGVKRAHAWRAAILFAVQLYGGSAMAGTITGKLELPPPAKRPPPSQHGFVVPAPNLLAPLRAPDPSPLMFVVLDPVGGGTGGNPPAQIELAIVGERFARPVVALPIGTDLVIRNNSKVTRRLTAAGAPAGVLENRPLNPTSTVTLHPAKAGDMYQVRAEDAPHLFTIVVVTSSAQTATLTADNKFEFANVPDGRYAVRVFYQNGWIERGEAEQVTVTSASKQDLKLKIPAGFPLKK